MTNAPSPVSIAFIGIGKSGITLAEYFQKNLKCPPHVDFQFVAVDSHSESLQSTTLKHTLQIGSKLTHGMGTQGDMQIAQTIAKQETPALEQLSDHHDILFLLCGLGGGTGSAIAPCIAQLARRAKALRIALCSLPFSFEGKLRQSNTPGALEQLQEHCHTTIALALEDLIGPKGTADATLKEANHLLLEAAHTLIAPLGQEDFQSYYQALRTLLGGQRSYAFARATLQEIGDVSHAGIDSIVAQLFERLENAKESSFVSSMDIVRATLCLTTRNPLNQEAIKAVRLQFQDTFANLQASIFETLVDPQHPEALSLHCIGQVESMALGIKESASQEEFNFKVPHTTFQEANHFNGENLDEPTYLRQGIKIRLQ